MSATFFAGTRSAKDHAARIIRRVRRNANTGSSPPAEHAPTRRTTIADVAREAGVNKGTVSRALRGISGVGPSTRERIIETADRLDFSASHLATRPGQRPFADDRDRAADPAVLVLQRVRLRGQRDPDPGRLSGRADQPRCRLRRSGRRLRRPFRQLFRELGAGRGRDALLFAGTISGRAATARPRTRPGFRPSPPASPLTSVPGIFINHRAGGRLIAEHLLGLGHRRIAIIDGRMPGKPDHGVWEQRTRRACGTVLRPPGSTWPPTDVVPPGDCHRGRWRARRWRSCWTGPASGRRRSSATPTSWPSAPWPPCAATGCAARTTSRSPGFDDHPMARYWGLTTVSQHAHDRASGPRTRWSTVLGGRGPDHGTRPEWISSGSTAAVELIGRETAGADGPRTRAQTTAARTESTSGRWAASCRQLSPSSVLAQTVPSRAPR